MIVVGIDIMKRALSKRRIGNWRTLFTIEIRVRIGEKKRHVIMTVFTLSKRSIKCVILTLYTLRIQDQNHVGPTEEQEEVKKWWWYEQIPENLPETELDGMNSLEHHGKRNHMVKHWI